MNHLAQLVDSFGRSHTSLRISVTDRCNIRCFYCMPSENVEFMPRPEVLTFEEITRVAQVFAELGVNKIRLTGGEPLVRKQLPVLIEQLNRIDQINEIALTTNGILLAAQAVDLHRAGLDRINVSMDSLDPAQFKQITRRDELANVLEGIAAAQKVGFTGIRINAVAVRGLIDEQILPLVKFAAEHGLELRFIEFMPLNAAGKWQNSDVLTGAEIRKLIEQEFGTLRSVSRENPSQPASDFELPDGLGRVGFINSVSEPFCEACDRLRMTADGKIQNCLFSNDQWDVRDLLRSGAADSEIAEQIRRCVADKRKAHGIGTAEFSKPTRAMYQIGG